MNKSKNSPLVCIVNGPPGSGKTSIASHYQKNSPDKVKVISVDKIRLTFSGSYNLDTLEGREVLKSSTINAARKAIKHLNSNKECEIIFIDDCIVEKRRMKLYYDYLKSHRIISVLLWPSSKVQKHRDATRHFKKRLGQHAIGLRRKMLRSKASNWHDIVMVNDKHSITETARILRNRIKRFPRSI